MGSSYPGARLKVIPPAEGAPHFVLLGGLKGWHGMGKYAEAFLSKLMT